MKYHCQVWVGGWSLVDITVDARSKKDAERKARRYVRERLGVKRLPRGTSVCIIPPGYYDDMVSNNRMIGVDITNW